MKSLLEYIKESRKYIYPQDRWQTLESFLEVNKINEASEDDLNWYSNYVCDVKKYNNPAKFVNNYGSPIEQIDEMLKSSTFSLIKKELNLVLNKDNKYPIYRDLSENEFKQGERTVNTICISTEIFDLDKIADICDKFMWTINSFATNKYGSFGTSDKPYHFEDNKGGYYLKLRIEPIQSTNYDNYVYNKCKGIVYHICKERKFHSIKKSGLRMKGSKNTYRKFEDKVFFCCGENEEQLKKALTKVIKSKGYWDWMNHKPYKDIIIIKVDVNNYNIHFYEDTYYNDKEEKLGIVYSYAYFPPKMLTTIKWEEI